MGRKSTRFDFPNGRGQTLAGTLDRPAGEAEFCGIFAPCFTCTKDSHGASKICRAMADGGAAMLRFDLTGLGGSEGDFADTNFSTRILDIVAACRAVEAEFGAAKLLVGHSISGTACLSAAKDLPDLQAVATLGSPCDPAYIIEKFERNHQIVEKAGGMVEVNIMGRPVLFRKSFAADMRAQNTAADTAALKPKLFIFHAPHDNIVAFDNAEKIAARVTGEYELIPLDANATHLFENRAEDALFVAETLLEWFRVHLK